MTLNRYKDGKYNFSHNTRKDYSYNELQEYFFIDGSEVIYCKKDFGYCKAGKYYLVYDGKWYGRDFIVTDWDAVQGREAGMDSWTDKEYMKK